MRAALILLLAVGQAGGATEALKARDQELRAALPPSGSPTPAQRKHIESIVKKTVDLEGMLQAALGPRWKTLTDKQRKRLVGAFDQRFSQLSGSELDQYRSTNVEYLPEKPGDDGAVLVPTKVVVKGEPTEIAYAMRQEKGGWRIVDIVVDGVSTVQNYRSSFNRVIQKEGVDALIAKLERGAKSKPAPASKGTGAANP